MSKSNDDDEEELKAILIGDTGVGKTNLIRTCLNQPFVDGYEPTITGSFLQKKIEIDGKKFSVYLWDTAGEEKYRGVTKLFFKGSQIVILVYDITNSESFKSLEEWYEMSKDIIGGDYIYGIVGNKNDMYTESKVKDEEVNKFAEKLNCLHAKASAKSNPELFNSFLEELIVEFKKIKATERRKSLKLKHTDKDNNIHKNKKCC